ncbi:glycosyltransferase family 1 protein [Amphibacillus sp. Q70]|uniref:glycosyltransferase family 1 protein n=1 Tax=Amphibacillus sp. Q70 TaxID=3453416 RepID=UPI003F830100
MDKKILFIVNSLSKGSGVMSFLMNIYRNIDSSKLKIDFVIGTEVETSYKNELIDLGAKIFYIPAPKKVSLKNFINYKKSIEEFFDIHQYDIIHSHVPIFNFIYFPIAKKFGVKYRIAHSHSTQSSSKISSKIRNYFLLLTLKKTSNYYFACSKQAALFLFGKSKYKKNQVKILNNAINTDLFSFKESIRKIKRAELDVVDKFVIGHVGRFASEKNHSYLLDIFYEIKNRQKNSVLVLVGEGKLFKEIHHKARSLGLVDSILFLGIRDDVNEIMQAMDAFLLPSVFEGLGIVAIEAQSVGLPCFVSNGVPKDVNLTDLISHLSLEKKPCFWADQICSIQRDNIKRSEYALKIKKQNYDIKKQVKWLEDFYLNIEGKTTTSSNDISP